MVKVMVSQIVEFNDSTPSSCIFCSRDNYSAKGLI